MAKSKRKSSSGSGANKKLPFKEIDKTETQLSIYAATKKCNEIRAYSYSEIYKLKCTALRFFTVFGPLGRPDMALYKFSKSILQNKNLELYNMGNHTRDFTFIDDVINNINERKLQKPIKYDGKDISHFFTKKNAWQPVWTNWI